MTPRTLSITVLATLALLALPNLAAAEYLVPEGNSAVTQYTEGFPTGGGEKKAEGSKHVTPGKAIGAGNAKKLQQDGPEGAAVAEVAAETAPPAAPAPESTPADESHGDGKQTKSAKQTQGGQNGKQQGSKQGGEEAAAAPASGGAGPSGSSGAGAVLGAATGASSGSVGLLLPLAILATVAWGLIFFWRRDRRSSPPAASQS